MYRQLKFLILINKSITRGQAFTVILEETVCPFLSQLMLWWWPVRTTWSHTACWNFSRFGMMVMHMMEKLKGRYQWLKNQLVLIFIVYLPSVTCTISRKRYVIGFLLWSRWIMKCNAVFQCWQITKFKSVYGISYPFVFLKRNCQSAWGICALLILYITIVVNVGLFDKLKINLKTTRCLLLFWDSRGA